MQNANERITDAFEMSVSVEATSDDLDSVMQ